MLTPLAACQSAPPTDYSAYLEHMPRSVLVLPPVNHTAEVGAPDAFLSTITQPLAERGYYVYPVVLVDQLMKTNGLPTPGDMRQAPLHKLGEVFGADAVLYIDILDWETKYAVIDSSTVVKMRYHLVDIDSETSIWDWEQQVVYSSSSGQSNIIGMVVAATAHQLTSGMAERERQLAVLANNTAVNNPRDGMLIGHRGEGYEEDQLRRRDEVAKRHAAQ